MLGGFGGNKDVLVRWETCDVRKEEEEKYDREAGNWSAFVWVFVFVFVFFFLIDLQYNKDLEFGFGFKFLKIGLVLNI